MTDKAAEGPKSSEKSGELGVLARVGKALGILFGVHLEFARREAKDDVGRLVAGVVMFAIGALLVVFALGLGHAAAVVAVHDLRGLRWLHAIGVVASADVFVAVIAFLVGRARLRKPLLKETRGLVKKTVTALVE